MRSHSKLASPGKWILSCIGIASSNFSVHAYDRKHFLNTVFNSEVPGEDLSLGTMSVINNTAELRRTFSYWAEEVLKVTPGISESDKKEVRDRIFGLSAFKWNVVPIVPNLYFETYLLDTWGNAFVGEDAVPTSIGYCSALTDHFAILVNGDLTYCCKDFDGKTTAGNVFDRPIVEILNSEPIIRAIEGFKKNRVEHPYCQQGRWRASGDFGGAASVGVGCGLF